jgi:acylphosphatase
MPRERRRVYFSGRVQGVGFRYTCQALAYRFDVAGFVRNLADGRVELVAEGEAVELDRFIDAIELEMSSYIRHTTSETEPPGSPRVAGFSIRH